jgi:hypothetical protein
MGGEAAVTASTKSHLLAFLGEVRSNLKVAGFTSQQKISVPGTFNYSMKVQSKG